MPFPRRSTALRVLWILWAMGAAAGCSFDYQTSTGEDDTQPDIVMRKVEYTRVRAGNPQVQFWAEAVERYEKRQTMELKMFSFKQYAPRGDEVNASGEAGLARVELDTGNVTLDGGVRLSVESEDIIMDTPALSWNDRDKVLAGNKNGAVNISRGDGTTFTGTGFSANTRTRTWEFSAGVEGTYVHEDKEAGEEGGAETAEAEGAS